tara:strand:- start:19379 stop:19780 length:402 start_codon:yes stop_codon:yes gene_type:complete
MKISKRQLKRIIREEYSRLKSQGLINEMSGVAFPDPELEQDTPYDRLMDGAENEPYDGYVEKMALAHVESQAGRLNFDEYADFAWDYGYRTDDDLDQLEEWWEAAIEESRGYSFRDSFGDGYGPGERRPTRRR